MFFILCITFSVVLFCQAGPDVNVTAAVSLPMQVAKILKTKTAHTANGSSCSRRRSEPSSCAERLLSRAEVSSPMQIAQKVLRAQDC